MALHLPAILGAQHRQCLVRFDSLRNDVQSERIPDRDDRVNDCGACRIGRKAVHEPLVDLDCIERKPQTDQVRIVFAKVVERDLDAKVLERMQG